MKPKTISRALIASLFVSAACAQDYALEWSSIGNGGGTSTGGVYSVSALIGEPVAGQMSGGEYTIDGGLPGDLNDAGELIVNGSFENINNTFVADDFGLMSLPAASVNILGWTTTTAELAWVKNANTFGPGTPFGAFALDLTGYHDSPPYAGVTQTLTTSPGQTYQLTFSLGAYQEVAAYGGPMAVGASVGSVSNVFTFTPEVGATGNVWMTFSLDFTATESATPLTLVGIATGGGAYLGLDAISVVPATPQPDAIQVAAERIGNDLRLRHSSEAGRSYAIQSHADLASAGWTTLPGTNTGTGGTLETTVSNAFVAPRQFYRVWQLP